MFDKLLNSQLQKAIDKSGFTKPTPIQNKVIPLVLEKYDILARAQTGSGKSASFILPILELLSRNIKPGKAKIKVLVLAPTRELTLQLSKSFEDFSFYLSKKPKIVSLIGGESIGDQLYDIQQGCDVLVATSGRFLDVVSKKQMNLSNVEFFVLDEADKMLSFAFEEQLELILAELPPKRQNLFFSATYPPKMQSILTKISQDYKEVGDDSEESIVETIKQRVIEVNRENRAPLIRHLLKTNKFKSVLIFMANKRASDNIAAKFRKYGLDAYSFNGDLEQEDRNITLEAFKDKKFKILFATDLASRGIDIEDIDCIINFDLPRSPSDYVHRIGRTGRAGKSGVAISLIGHEDQEHFKLIEKRAGIKIQREQLDGFELSGAPIVKEKGKAPVKGKGKSKKDKLREKALKDKNK